MTVHAMSPIHIRQVIGCCDAKRMSFKNTYSPEKGQYRTITGDIQPYSIAS
jgi:hypothetical protein